MIGIMGVLEEEVSLYISKAEIEAFETYAGMKFYWGKLGEESAVIVQSGAGKVNAAIAAQILVDRYNIDRMIFTGPAGALVPYLQRGDLVAANYLVQYDIDLTSFGRHVGEVPSVGRMIEADSEMLKQVTDAYDAVFSGMSNRPQMIIGTVVSGDRFISDRKTIAWLQREFGAVATEMEGAAVAQVCQMNDKPFLVIRTISDSAVEDAPEEFESTLKSAPENAFYLLRNLLGSERMEKAVV
jgi:adenosylhomocysteine nucleosidase